MAARINAGGFQDFSRDVLRHRIILTYEAKAQAMTTDAIIKKIFNAVPVS